MEPTRPKDGLPIVGGKPYDPEDDFADSILRGIDKGLEQRRAEEAAEAAKGTRKTRGKGAGGALK